MTHPCMTAATALQTQITGGKVGERKSQKEDKEKDNDRRSLLNKKKTASK